MSCLWPIPLLQPSTMSGVLLLALFAFSGCGRAREASSRDLQRLARESASSNACSPSEMTVVGLHPRVAQVNGCGTRTDYHMTADRHWHPMMTFPTYASEAMQCPEQALLLRAPLRSTRLAEGCGRSARFELACDEVQCAWVMIEHTGAWADTASASAPSFVVEAAPVQPVSIPAPVDESTADVALPEAPRASP
jgi:hypothetical protein